MDLEFEIRKILTKECKYINEIERAAITRRILAFIRENYDLIQK